MLLGKELEVHIEDEFIMHQVLDQLPSLISLRSPIALKRIKLISICV